MGAADELRTATLGTPSRFASRLVEVGAGRTIEVRMPTEADQETIRGHAVIVRGMGPAARTDVDVAQLRAWRVALCCYVPGTTERVFGPEHVADFLARPAHGGWYSDLADAAGELIGEAISAGKASSATSEAKS